MKKLILFITLSLSYILSSGQKGDVWMGANFFMGTYEYYLPRPELVGQNGISFNLDYSKKVGVNAQYFLRENIFVHGGLNYSSWSSKLTYYYIFGDSNDPIIPDYTTLNMSFLEVPILIG